MTRANTNSLSSFTLTAHTSTIANAILRNTANLSRTHWRRQSADNIEQLMNAYNNTIIYTDTFLSEVISVLDKSGKHAALLYLADHGEDIFDDERGRFLHASPNPTYWQIHVPMIVSDVRELPPRLPREI